MQIENLRYFIELEKHDSFSKAAASVFITQQGFGKAIAALEEELGVELVKRSSRGVTLTPEGLCVMEYAKRIVGDQTELVRKLSLTRQTSNPTRLLWMCTSYMTQAVSSLWRDQNTYSTLDLREVPFLRGIELLKNGQGAPVLTAEVFPETKPLLEADAIAIEPFFNATLGILWRNTCPVSNPSAASLEEAAELSLMSYSGGSIGDLVRRVFPGAFLDRLKLASSYSSIADDVLYGNGTALIDSFAFNSLERETTWKDAEFRFTPIADERVRFYIAWLYSRNQSLPPDYRLAMNSAKTLYSSI